MRRRARMRGTVGTIMLGLGVLSVAGCSGSSGNGGDGQARSTAPASPVPASPASPAAIPAGFTTITGATYQFGVPAALSFAVDSERVTDEGGLIKRWRYAITPKGPFCVVVTTEQ